MKKESAISFVTLIVVLAVAVVMGLFVVRDAFDRLYTLSLSPIIFTLIGLIIGFIFNIVLIELAHATGAKLGKCKVVSLCFYFIAFVKTKAGFKVKIDDFDGLTGETKIIAKDKNSRLNAFVWMPLVFYAIELAVCIILYTMANDAKSDSAIKWVGLIGLLWIILSSILIVYDFLPFRMDTMTDGYRLILLSNKKNAEPLLSYMSYQGKKAYGEDCEFDVEFTEITDFTADLNFLSAERALLKGDYEKVNKIIKILETNKESLNEQSKYHLSAVKLFMMFNNENNDDVKEYYEKEIDDKTRKFLSNDVDISSLRTYALIAGLIDQSEFEVQYACSKKEKSVKRCPKEDWEAEGKLFDQVIERIKEAHPKWVK